MLTMIRAGGAAALLGSLALGAAGCGTATPAGPATQATRQGATHATSAPSASVRAWAAAYLAIAKPANHRLDAETSAYGKDAHWDLAAARSDLLAEAATEHGFDQRLAKIAFPPRIAATARAMIRANQHRIALTEQQARSMTLAELASFTRDHAAADAAVEVQSRIIRRELGLPPPPES